MSSDRSPIHIAFLCMMEPTPENGSNGPGSLPFWTLRYAPSEITVDLCFLTNEPINERIEAVRSALSPLKLRHVIASAPPSALRRKLGGFLALCHGLPPGIGTRLPSRKMIRTVRSWGASVIWIYPNYWLSWCRYLSAPLTVLTAPDAESLWVRRAYLAGTHIYHKAISLPRARRLDAISGTLPDLCHVVGENDRMELENASSKKGQAFFIPHPHPPVKDCSEPIHAVTGKLTALISGGGQGFPRLYSGEYLPRLIKTLANSANDFRDQYRICLVGKGYESHAEELRQAGYEVKVRSWVENYSELLGECQIQIFPIQVGSGTKGKVLQAMGSGLLAIATPMAMENISAEPDQDYLLYEIPEQVPLLLARILSDRTAASQIALAGRDAILRWHNPEYTASLFWKHVLRSYAQTTTHRDNGDI